MVRRSRYAQEVKMAGEVPSKFNVYGAITAKIVRAIKEKPGKFEMPWHTVGSPMSVPINAITNEPYRGVNILSLWIDGITREFPTGYWGSYRQWQSIDAQVRAGERGCMIVFYKKVEAKDNELELLELPRYLARAYWVFNAAQVDGFTPPVPRERVPVEVNEGIDAFVRATEAKFDHGGYKACYRRDFDLIEMPHRTFFMGSSTRSPTEAYYAVMLHELTHWTGAPHRLDRNFGMRFGDEAYAFEELVAELGAAFMCAAFRISNEPRPDHAAYVDSWLKVLNDDPRAIFTASTRAQEAIEYLGSIAAQQLDPLAQAS
jgi:antirestriction protein ArdC